MRRNRVGRVRGSGVSHGCGEGAGVVGLGTGCVGSPGSKESGMVLCGELSVSDDAGVVARVSWC